MASFYRVDNESSRLPSMLGALEEQNFLFQLQLIQKEEEDSNEVRTGGRREVRGEEGGDGGRKRGRRGRRRGKGR